MPVNGLLGFLSVKIVSTYGVYRCKVLLDLRLFHAVLPKFHEVFETAFSTISLLKTEGR